MWCQKAGQSYQALTFSKQKQNIIYLFVVGFPDWKLCGRLS